MEKLPQKYLNKINMRSLLLSNMKVKHLKCQQVNCIFVTICWNFILLLLVMCDDTQQLLAEKEGHIEQTKQHHIQQRQKKQRAEWQTGWLVQVKYSPCLLILVGMWTNMATSAEWCRQSQKTLHLQDEWHDRSGKATGLLVWYETVHLE